MLYIAVAELFAKSEENFAVTIESEGQTNLFSMLSFFGGALIMLSTDIITHQFCGHENAESYHMDAGKQNVTTQNVTTYHMDAGKQNVTNKQNTTQKKDVMMEQVEIDEIEADIKDAKNNNEKETEANEFNADKMYTLGLKTVLAIALHNFPEGLASYLSTIADGRTGLAITFG